MNFAQIGNLIFERGAVEGVPEFRERVRDSVAELGGGVIGWGAPYSVEWIEPAPEVVMIAGGINEDASGDIAQFGDTLIEREHHESLEEFQRRARATAQAAGFGFVAFGGLPEIKTEGEVNVDL